MSHSPNLANRVRDLRATRAWSQAELAQRSGLSRAEISAIEIGRVVPSTGAALDLAAAFGCAVEDIFYRDAGAPPAPAWPAQRETFAVWRAAIDGRDVLYPVERTHLGSILHDGRYSHGAVQYSQPANPPGHTLVIAGCDPSVAVLAMELARTHRIRTIPLIRSSANALALLKQGLVHVAGTHLGGGAEGRACPPVSAALGSGYRTLHMARWQEGLVVAPGSGIRSVREALHSSQTWIGRETGSGARHCLDALFAGEGTAPREFEHIAPDHRSVADCIRMGWAQLGVGVRLVAEEAGLDFLSVREEDYNLCFCANMENDPRITALVQTLRAASFRRQVGELPGYDTTHTGALGDAA